MASSLAGHGESETGQDRLAHGSFRSAGDSIGAGSDAFQGGQAKGMVVNSFIEII